MKGRICCRFFLIVNLHCDSLKCINKLRCWCETCQGPVKPNCCKEKHQLRDLLKDVHESQGLVVGTSVKLKESRQKRSQVKVHLLNKKKKLQCELKSVDVELAENENGQHELSEMISNCEQLQNLLPVDKVQAFLQKNRLELTMQRFKDVGKEADKTYKLIVEQSGMVLRSLLLFYSIENVLLINSLFLSLY